MAERPPSTEEAPPAAPIGKRDAEWQRALARFRPVLQGEERARQLLADRVGSLERRLGRLNGQLAQLAQLARVAARRR